MADATIEFGKTATTCPLTKYVQLTMESDIYYGRYKPTKQNLKNADIFATVNLATDVPLVYGGWHDFGFMEKVPEKERRTDAVACAFISNCGPSNNNRLALMKKLMDRGVR